VLIAVEGNRVPAAVSATDARVIGLSYVSRDARLSYISRAMISALARVLVRKLAHTEAPPMSGILTSHNLCRVALNLSEIGNCSSFRDSSDWACPKPASARAHSVSVSASFARPFRARLLNRFRLVGGPELTLKARTWPVVAHCCRL
jgi:hypothetical protein